MRGFVVLKSVAVSADQLSDELIAAVWENIYAVAFQTDRRCRGPAGTRPARSQRKTSCGIADGQDEPRPFTIEDPSPPFE